MCIPAAILTFSHTVIHPLLHRRPRPRLHPMGGSMTAYCTHYPDPAGINHGFTSCDANGFMHVGPSVCAWPACSCKRDVPTQGSSGQPAFNTHTGPTPNCGGLTLAGYGDTTGTPAGGTNQTVQAWCTGSVVKGICAAANSNSFAPVLFTIGGSDLENVCQALCSCPS